MRTGVICEIEKVANGFTVCVQDPSIVAANAKRDSSKGYIPYKDPEVEYVFPDLKKALKWIEENGETLTPESPSGSFSAAWNEATKGD
jgi:hypothetical protein